MPARPVLVGLLMAILPFIFFGPLSCRSGYSGPAESITIGAPALDQNALLYVAEAQGMFTRRGLKVIIQDYETGGATLGALMQGSADIAQTAEFPFIHAVFKKDRVSALAINDRMMIAYLIARKDHGILSVPDLKGKRIGVARGTIVDFFLGRFLELQGLSLKDVTLVDLPPSEFLDAVHDGVVDALAAWQPYIYRAIEREGDGLVVWSVNNNQPAYGILVARDEWLAQHGPTAERFLRSLADAESFVARNPDRARAIVQRRLKYDAAYVAGAWPQHHFSLSLNLSLITAMNDEARWLMDNNLTQEKAIPDFRNYVYVDGLKAVRPDAVNITR